MIAPGLLHVGNFDKLFFQFFLADYPPSAAGATYSVAGAEKRRLFRGKDQKSAAPGARGLLAFFGDDSVTLRATVERVVLNRWKPGLRLHIRVFDDEHRLRTSRSTFGDIASDQTYLSNPRNPRFLSACRSHRFEGAVFWRPLPHARREFHFACDQVRCLKFPSAHQCACVATDIADRKFHRARKRDGIAFQAPLCLRRLIRAPSLRLWVGWRQTAFPLALRLKAHRAALFTSESDLQVPGADDVRCLRVTHSDALGDQQQNQRSGCCHVVS
jgi:hypothetical protein